MATATPLTQPTWQHNGIEVRSVALAERQGYTAGAARYYVGLRDGCEAFKVLSERSHTHDYFVTYDPANDLVVSCTCPARGACKHLGAVRLWVERRKAMVAPVDAPAPVLTVVPVAPRTVPVLTHPLRYGTCEACGEMDMILEAYEPDEECAALWCCQGGCDAGWLDLTA